MRPFRPIRPRSVNPSVRQSVRPIVHLDSPSVHPTKSVENVFSRPGPKIPRQPHRSKTKTKENEEKEKGKEERSKKTEEAQDHSKEYL